MPAENPSAVPPEPWANKDAFISYASIDSAWVREELIPALVANGITYTIDTEHFPPGGDLDALIEAAAKGARKTIAVLTPAYLDSPYCRFENRLLETLDPAAAQRRLLPIVLQPCTVPERWKGIVRVEIMKVADREKGLGKILREIKPDAKVPPRISRRTLTQLFTEPAVHPLVEKFTADIERAGQSFDQLEHYKDLHEALHQAMEPRTQLELRKDELRAAPTAEAWRNVEPPLTSFVAALRQVCDAVTDSDLTDNEWNSSFLNAIEVLPQSHAAQNLEGFARELASTLYSLDTVPTALNQSLKLKSEGLRLEELFRQLEGISDEVRRLNLSDEAAALFARFQEQTKCFAERARALPAFIAVHTQLQILNNGLARLDQKKLDLEALKRGWKITTPARDALRKLGPPEGAFWFADLATREQAVAAALATPAPEAATVADPFRNYMQTLTVAFSTTDRNLRKLLKKMDDFSGDVVKALTAMRLPPKT
jgi:hypothetical protein